MEWISESQWLWWVGAALALGLVEVASLDLVFAMLTIGALAASGTALAGGSFTVQVLVFAAVSGFLLVVARPLALKKLKPAGPGQRTGTAAHVGRRAEVLETVTDRSGLVKLAGETWSARSHEPGRVFAPGDVVEVLTIEGATAVVRAGSPPPQPGTEGQEIP